MRIMDDQAGVRRGRARDAERSTQHVPGPWHGQIASSIELAEFIACCPWSTTGRLRGAGDGRRDEAVSERED